MIHITEQDFAPFETFPLSRRWSQQTHARFSKEEQAQIQPLTAAKAKELWDETEMYWGQIGGYLREATDPSYTYIPKVKLFEALALVIAAKEVALFEQIGRDLLVLEPHSEMQIVVIWEPTQAVLTSWRFFCVHWYNFCYPISDDVRIYPMSERWFLTYTHNEFFTFGRLFPPEQERELRKQLAVFQAPRPLSEEGRREIERLVRRGEHRDIFNAMKLYSQEANVTLKTAKESIDEMVARIKREQSE